jgi:hypothetical protein
LQSGFLGGEAGLLDGAGWRGGGVVVHLFGGVLLLFVTVSKPCSKIVVMFVYSW